MPPRGQLSFLIRIVELCFRLRSSWTIKMPETTSTTTNKHAKAMLVSTPRARTVSIAPACHAKPPSTASIGLTRIWISL